MFYFRMTIRYILSIGAAFCIIGFCIESLEWHLLGFLGWPALFFGLFLYLPAMILFPIISAFNYFIKGKFWSVFKTEYYLWFANLGLYGLLILIDHIIKH